MRTGSRTDIISIISTHAPAWGATTVGGSTFSAFFNFNSRPRVGGDPAKGLTGNMHHRFQLTPPRGGRRRGAHGADPARDFNSRPRVGGDGPGERQILDQGQISTHAPAWGATASQSTGIQHTDISTHAPAWGATHADLASSAISIDFNSRPRVGGDLDSFYPSQRNLISTHAPAWGATARICLSIILSFYFNSRPRVGGDSIFNPLLPLYVSFQLTPPRGGRQRANQQVYNTPTFQLTPPRGGRLPLMPGKSDGWDFNSRPRVGGD